MDILAAFWTKTSACVREREREQEETEVGGEEG